MQHEKPNNSYRQPWTNENQIKPNETEAWVTGLLDRPARKWISSSRVGCHIGGIAVNIFAYADDIVLLAFSWHALQDLLSLLDKCCEEGPCTYRHFNFPFQMENEKWKMDTQFHFPFFSSSIMRIAYTKTI